MPNHLGRFQCDPKPGEEDPMVTCYISEEREDDVTGEISYILDTTNPVLLPLSEFVARVEKGHEWFVNKQRAERMAKKQAADDAKAEAAEQKRKQEAEQSEAVEGKAIQ